MISWTRLKALYEKNSSATAVGIEELGNFFQRTLQILNATASHIIEEIETIKEEVGPKADPKTLHQHYHLLREFCGSDEGTAGRTR
jgi:hypothetical protein